MATRIPSPGVLELLMRFTQDNQLVENVYHVSHDGPWGTDEMNEIAGTFVGWWQTYMQGVVPTNVTLREVICQDLRTGGAGIIYSSGLPLAGTNPSPALPNSVSLAVKWGTGLRGRSYRGRTYQIGMVEGAVNGNTVVPGSLEVFRSAYDALRTALDNATLGVEFCVLSQTTDGAPRVAGVCTPISGITIDPTVDNQRRRLPGRGR